MRRAHLVLAAAVLAALGLAPAAIAAGNTAQENIPYDGSELVQSMPTPKQKYPHGIYPSTNPDGVGDSTNPPLHDGRAPDMSLTLFSLDSANPGTHQVPFWKEYAGEHADIFVGWNDLAAPATSVQQDHTLTPAQLAYIGKEFDERSWKSNVFHFGNYKARCPGEPIGSNACGTGKRAQILIYNIRDEAYFAPFRFYVVGFFSASMSDALGRNVVFIDSFNWKDRTGLMSARPFLYEATVAHEFQHLIHNDVDPDEDSFIDEGMADMAEQFVYGTGTTASHVAEYLFFHRDSLTDWDGELYDYGNGLLWQDYLWERAGGVSLGSWDKDPLAGRVAPGHSPFEDSADKFVDPGDRSTWNLIHEQANGIQGVANQRGGLAAVKALHHDFTLANLLDGKVAEPNYNYRNLVLGGADSEGFSIDDGIAFYDSNVSGNMPPTRKNVRRLTVVEPWSAYYRTFTGAAPGFTMAFNGTASDGVAANSPVTQWYAGLGNNLQRTLEKTVTAAPGDTLKFMTWYDIEVDWDYGYVEASADGGSTWTKLQQVTALRSGTTDVNGSSAWDGVGGLTGNSGGWQAAEYSFGSLAGTLKLRFRYATDEAVNGQGWYVDDVQVGAGAVDRIDTASGWTTNGWLFTNGLQGNDWTADFYAPSAKGQTSGYALGSIPLTTSGSTVSGSRFVPMQFKKDGVAYGVIGNRPDGVFDATGRLTIAKSQG